MRLSDCPLGSTHRLERLGGEASFRRRLMELGLLPGTLLTVLGRAPLGGPLELLVRGCSFTLGREDASAIEVSGALTTCPHPPRHDGNRAATRALTINPRGWLRLALRGPRPSP